MSNHWNEKHSNSVCQTLKFFRCSYELQVWRLPLFLGCSVAGPSTVILQVTLGSKILHSITTHVSTYQFLWQVEAVRRVLLLRWWIHLQCNKNNPELLVRLIVVFLTTSILSEISPSKMFQDELAIFILATTDFLKYNIYQKLTTSTCEDGKISAAYNVMPKQRCRQV